MANEDFTFPITTTTPPLSIDSPPLWSSTSSSSRHEKSGKKDAKCKNKEEEELGDGLSTSKVFNRDRRKSLSYVEGGVKAESDDVEEENMDLLWEDFNEEVSRSCGGVEESGMTRRRVAGLGWGQAFKLAKAGGGRRPSVVVLMKLLKKVFVLHNSHRSLNNMVI